MDSSFMAQYVSGVGLVHKKEVVSAVSYPVLLIQIHVSDPYNNFFWYLLPFTGYW